MPPAAKQGDRVTAVDPHLIQPPGPVPPVLVPHPFNGILDGGLSPDVEIEGRPAATKGSTARNTPAHVPLGGTFVNPPNNTAEITGTASTVEINGRPAARAGDTAKTCQDVPGPPGLVVAFGTVEMN